MTFTKNITDKSIWTLSFNWNITDLQLNLSKKKYQIAIMQMDAKFKCQTIQVVANHQTVGANLSFFSFLLGMPKTLFLLIKSRTFFINTLDHIFRKKSHHKRYNNVLQTQKQENRHTDNCFQGELVAYKLIKTRAQTV